MNTVSTINLAGTAFQIEDPGYLALKKYLDDARASLSANPDRDEIMDDMERSIADKCRACLAPHKNVVTEAEAAKIVDEMGPVNASEGESAQAGTPRKPKRLYRVVDGEVIAGVANGIAVYFDVDPMLIRIAFVLLTIFTGGGFLFGYLLAWVFIPVAETPEQRAQAHGEPFNAQEIIDRVKTEYARLEQRAPEWKRQWNEWQSTMTKQHDAHKAWKQQRRQQWRWEQRQYRHQGPSVVGQLLQLIVVVFLIWLGYHQVPQIHDFLNAVWNLLNQVVNSITAAIVAH